MIRPRADEAFAVLLVSVIELRAQERRTARSQQVLVAANELGAAPCPARR